MSYKLALLPITLSALLFAGCNSSQNTEATDAQASPEATATEGQEITIATESSYKPFSYTDADGKLNTVRLAFGGIGSVPWRDKGVEALLMSSHGEMAAINQAVDKLLATANPHPKNAFKLPLTRRIVIQAIRRAINAAQSMSASPSASAIKGQ